MPANLQIDDRLLDKARRIGGFRTKSDTVDQALAEFLRRRERRSIAGLFGTVGFAPGFDPKKQGAGR
ncbi:MAG TPA: type II toxin-antitoxin system VapB family antitoxin [Opitutaceae bacterium]|nr:type II toxin-antitoxin system VapB family antitoxin [Opitutaceae bacterium]